VAHAKKSFDGGLDELRSVLAHEGVEPLWLEVPKSRKAPKAVKQAMAEGADLIFVWGGDGTVQRCLDTLAGTGVDVAILPAGTANLLATNLGVPTTIEEAVQTGLHGRRRPLDLGRINGEHFAVMAGAGLDALMIRDADRGLKDKAGRLAYVWTGIRNVKARRVRMTIDVDGQQWFKGDASCVLVANVSTIVGGLAPFEKARPDDGVLEIGVVEAEGALQWARVFGRMAVGKIETSPLTRTTSARRVDITTKSSIDYELDGGHRGTARKLKIRVKPAAVRICVPDGEDDADTDRDGMTGS
jgi:YegS/Rv2252/BmrU family lipid kinase